jgi:Glycosyltransferase
MLKTIITQRRNYSIAQVNIYSGPAFLWAAVVCQLLRQLRKPYVLSLHGGNLPVFAARWPNTVKYILRSAAAVTAPSRYLLEHMSPYRKHVRLVPNGLALDQYAFTLREKPNPFLVWVRAFHKTYNPLLGLTVATLLRDSFPDLRMIMVGPDEGDGTLEEVKDLATKSTLDGRITLSGCISKSEVPTWINKGDIF